MASNFPTEYIRVALQTYVLQHFFLLHFLVMLKSILEKGSGSIWIIWKGLGVTDVQLNAHSALKHCTSVLVSIIS